MRKTLMHSIWLVWVLSVLSSSVCAGQIGDLFYEITNEQMTITRCNSRAEGDLVIPNQIEDLPVTIIGVGALRSCKNLR